MAIEIVSVHIRKSGGISFRNTLSRMYGDALSVDYPSNKQEVTEKTRVIHGHIQASEFAALYPQAKFITWMRSPLERYVSRFFYIKYHFAESVERQAPLFQRIINNSASFRDYLEEGAPGERARWYLDGMPLAKFFYVGIMEHFEEDLEKLARRLEWQGDYSLVHWNRTIEFVEKTNPAEVAAYQAFQVSPDDRRYFEQHFGEEIELYAQALKLRAERMQRCK